MIGHRLVHCKSSHSWSCSIIYYSILSTIQHNHHTNNATPSYLLDLGQHVLTIILQLAHDDDKEELRMTAAQLLNMLAECLGQDLCKQFVIPEVVSLSEDPVFRVRKSTALNFHNICRVGGDYELFERLMPAFVRLSKDDM